MQITDHQHYMNLAFALAEKGRFTVSPNPMVGCVIVKDDQVIGQGYHERAGEAHAEIKALQDAGENAQGATVYVTLEPCCHKGRTHPCVNALIEAGIKKVYVATIDPNPIVCGRGVTLLRKAGIEVEIGLCGERAHTQNEIFFHYIKQQKPFVIAKWAMSLDGKTITHQHDAKQISDKTSQQHAHHTREQVDAILVGANTIREDDPQLTARNHATAKQPVRIILSSQADLPVDAKIFSLSLPGKTIIATTDLMSEQTRAALAEKNIETLVISKDEDDLINLHELLSELGKMQITSVLVEGGERVRANFFKQGLVNRIQVYLAPNIIGGLEIKRAVTQMNVTTLANDFYITGDIDV